MGQEYAVDRIIGRRTSLCRGTEYLILWMGYSLDHSTWEPLKQLACSTKIDEFEQRCTLLRLKQQTAPELPAVDQYEDYGIVTLVDEGHEYMAAEGSGFESPAEDFDFVGDGSSSNNNNDGSAANGKARSTSRDPAIHYLATHGWHRMRKRKEGEIEECRSSSSPLIHHHSSQGEFFDSSFSSSLLQPTFSSSSPLITLAQRGSAEIKRIRGALCDGGGRVYYLVVWSDEGVSWEAPSGFVGQQALEVLTKFETLQFAQERRALCKTLQDSRKTTTTVQPRSPPSVGMAGGCILPDSLGIRAGQQPHLGGGDEGFNLKSSSLAPIAPTEGKLSSPVAKMSPVAARSGGDSSDESPESTPGRRSASALSSSSSGSGSSENSRQSGLKRRRRRLLQRGDDSPVSKAENKAEALAGVYVDHSEGAKKAEALAGVYIDHSEGEELRRRGVSRRAMLRMARERSIAREALQRATEAKAEAKAEKMVEAEEKAEKMAEAENKMARKEPERTAEKNDDCCVCQLPTRAADAWGCVECRLWFHRACYGALARRVGASAEHLEALEDAGTADFVCLLCSRHSRRTAERFLTWRGTGAASQRVNMAGVDVMVKWRGVAFRHLDWVPFVWLQAQPAEQRRCLSLRLRVASAPQPPHLADAFAQAHLEPAAIIGARLHVPGVAAERLRRLRSAPPAGVGEAAWALHVTCEAVWVVWRGLGARDATWEAPPSPHAAPAEYLAWHAEYAAWRRAEGVSLREHLRHHHPLEANKEGEHLRHHRPLEANKEAVAVEEYTRQPEFIRGGTLYAYQLAGANWLLRRWRDGASGVLADEMGLGKTVQAIAFLLMAFHSTLLDLNGDSALLDLNRGTFPFLVVAPTTLLANWAAELRAWAPRLVVAQLSGAADDRAVELEHVIFRQGTRDLRCHVVLASYEAVARQAGLRELGGVRWQAVVCDEGHRLKNDQAKAYRALAQLDARARVVLTGTLVQNDLRELAAVLSFVDPAAAARLGGRELERAFGGGEAAGVARVHALIRPYILRRTKADVPSLVPPKHEVLVPVSMTPLQRELCRATLAKSVRMLQSIASALHRNNHSQSQDQIKCDRVGSRSLTNVLMEVRMLASHPYNLPNVEPRFASPAESHAQMVAASGKLRLLHALLPELRRRGHRALVFAQFKRTLDILEDYLDAERVACARIDGDTPARLRQAAVDRFNAPGSPLLVFLLSTRTGGTGLNLTGADVVVVYDCDFNPQADIQAVARAHRIGQTRPVTVLKLVTENSAEERIVRRATRKLLIDHLVIGNLASSEVGDAGSSSAAAQQLDLPQTDIEAALRCDARSLFEDNDAAAEDRAIVYDQQRVSALLDQCQAALAEETRRLAEEEGGSAGARKASVSASAFGMARVWAMDRDGRMSDVANDKTPPGTVVEDEEESGDSIWARLLEQTSTAAAVAADDGDDGSGGGLAGDGPRLRVRKRKVDYVQTTDASGDTPADMDYMDDGDGSVDGDDDDDNDGDYGSGGGGGDALPPPSVHTPGVTVVRPGELVAVVKRHINGIIHNYETSSRLDPSLRPANWDQHIYQGIDSLMRPMSACNFQPISPPLLFSMPTDLRLWRGSHLPSQPMDSCPLCKSPESHGTSYCPRIRDPEISATVGRIKQIPEYWAHRVFHSFVCWYTIQYIWFVLGDPHGLAVNDANTRTYRSYAVSAECYAREVRAINDASRKAKYAKSRSRAIVAAAAKRVVPELADLRVSSDFAYPSSSTLTNAAAGGSLGIYDDPLPLPLSSLGMLPDTGGGAVFTKLFDELHRRGSIGVSDIPSSVDDLLVLGRVDLPRLRVAVDVLSAFIADLRSSAVGEKCGIRRPVDRVSVVVGDMRRMVEILELAVVYRSRIVERVGWLEKQPVSAPIPRVSAPIARVPSSAVAAPVSVHRTPASVPAPPVSAPIVRVLAPIVHVPSTAVAPISAVHRMPVSAPALPVSTPFAPISTPVAPVSAPSARVPSTTAACVSAPAASVSAPAAPVSAPAAPITPERVLEEDNSMELDTPAPAVSDHPAPMDVEHPAPSSDLDEPAETCSDSVVPSVNGDSQFDEPPGAHGVRMALGKLLSIHGHLLAASNGGAELNPSVILSIEDILEKTRIAVTDSLLEQCKASPNLRGMLPLLLFLDRMKTAPCSTPTERSTRSVAIGKCLQQLLLWVKTNIRDVTAVAPTLGRYRVAIELADIDGAPTASASVVGSAKPSPVTAATTCVVSPDTLPPPPHPHSLSSKLTAPAVAPRPVHVANMQKVAAPDTPASTVIGARTPQASPPVPPVQIQPTQQPMRAHSHSHAMPTANDTPASTVIGARTPQASPSVPPVQIQLTQQPMRTHSHLHAMPTVNYSMGQNALGLVSVTSQPPSLPSFGYSHSAGHLHTTGSHIAFTPATSATQQRPAPVSSQSYGPWSRQPAPSSLANALASEYVNATAAAAAVASSSSQSPSSSSVSSQAASSHQTLQTPQQLQWAQMESEQREQQKKQERLQQEQFEREKQQRLQNERLQQQQQQQQQQQYRPQRMTLQQQQQQQQQLVQQFYELQRMYPHLSPQQIQAFMVQQQQIQQQIQQAQQNVRFLQHAAGGGGGQQPQPQQLVTPISGNYETLVVSQQLQQQQQPPSSAGSYGRQMPAANAPSTWQANASSGYGLQSAAGAVSPPVYVESLNGFAATCDMTCVICEDPLHTPSSCPHVKDVGHLAQRRVSINNCAKLPPNMKEVMLTTIDKYLRQALG